MAPEIQRRKIMHIGSSILVAGPNPKGVCGMWHPDPSPPRLSAKLCPSAKWCVRRQNEKGDFFWSLFAAQLFRGSPFCTFIGYFTLIFDTVLRLFVCFKLFFFLSLFSPRKFSRGQPFGKNCKEKKWWGAVGKLMSRRQIDTLTPPSIKVLATPLPGGGGLHHDHGWSLPRSINQEKDLGIFISLMTCKPKHTMHQSCTENHNSLRVYQEIIQKLRQRTLPNPLQNIRPHLEYCVPVRNPGMTNDISVFGKVQRSLS